MKVVWRVFIVSMMASSGGLHCQEKLLPPSPPQPEVLDENARSLDMGMLLDDAQVNKFMIRAESGDGEAAYRLSSHFASINNMDKARYWLFFSAARGYSVAQYNMWFDLKDEPDCRSRIEALAWLKSAAINGSLQASKKIKGFSMVEKECL